MNKNNFNYPNNLTVIYEVVFSDQNNPNNLDVICEVICGNQNNESETPSC